MEAERKTENEREGVEKREKSPGVQRTLVGISRLADIGGTISLWVISLWVISVG